MGSQLCDFVDVIQPFRAHVPSSVKRRLSQDQMKYFREQCFPDHPNKNTNLLIIHLFFSALFFSITAAFVYLGSQNKSPQIGWLKQQEFVSPLFWKLEVQDQQVWFLLMPGCRPHCVLSGLSSMYLGPGFSLYVQFPTLFHWNRVCFTHGSSQVALVVKNLPANAGEKRAPGSIPGRGRSPGGGGESDRLNALDIGMAALLSQPVPHFLPHCAHKPILCVCPFIPALQRGSSAPFF